MSPPFVPPDPLADREAAAFSEPWMARLFALTLGLSERDLFSLKDFQAALIEAVGSREKTGCIDDEESYYTCWLAALTGLLRERAVLPEETLGALERSIRAEATARREHQNESARDSEGRLRVAPVVVA